MGRGLDTTSLQQPAHSGAGMASTDNETRPRIIFSDIDGTLAFAKLGDAKIVPTAHGTLTCTLEHDGQELSTEIIALPRSSTGQQGYVSIKALQMLHQLRQSGAKVVIVTGARSSTLLERLPYLPVADAVVSENGGRIFYADGDWPSVVPLREDMDWRAGLASATGPIDNDGKEPHEREGVLWDKLRECVAAGYKVDARSYYTAFRVVDKENVGGLKEKLASLPEGLASTINLGMSDVYPAGSGKQGAAIQIAKHFNADLCDCAFLCDDDNDIQLAKVVGKAYLPSVAADSIQKLVELDPSHFHAASLPTVFGTEQAVEALQKDWGLHKSEAHV
eukprot:jgi/Ulvmu1/455/UM001_0462.1